MTATPVGTVDAAAQFPILTVGQAQSLVDANPNDPRAHFALSIAQSFAPGAAGKAKKVEQDFSVGLKLAGNNAELLMQVASQMARNPRIGPAAPAYLFATAYALAADKNPAIRAQAGQFLYRYAQTVHKRDLLFTNTVVVSAVNRLGEMVQNTQSAPLHAFIALAYHHIEQAPDSAQAIASAQSLNPDSPEVHLVQGILDVDQNDPGSARKELTMAAASSDAPTWVVDEAKRLLKGL